MGLTQTPFLAMQGGAIWVHFMHLNPSPITHHCSQIHSLSCTFTTNSTTCTYSSIITHHCSHMHKTPSLPSKHMHFPCHFQPSHFIIAATIHPSCKSHTFPLYNSSTCIFNQQTNQPQCTKTSHAVTS